MYRLLIADDEPLEREAIRLFVEESHLDIEHVYECGNGTDAVRVCLLEKPDIVLLDINMPGLNGLDVLERIRVANKKCRVIISSAYDYFEYAKKAMQLNSMDFLVKPVKQGVLISALTKAVDELDAEAAAEDRLNRMAGMIETMEGRIVLDMVAGTISDETCYYLEAIGVGQDSSGIVFHAHHDEEKSHKDGEDIAKELRKLLSLLDVSSLCWGKGERALFVVFPKSGAAEDGFYCKLKNVLSSTVEDIDVGWKLGMGEPFDGIERVADGWTQAREATGDLEAKLGGRRGDREMPRGSEKIRAFIDGNFAKRIGLDDIADAVGSSKYHICRLFKQNMGITIVDYLVGKRIDRAKELLKAGEYSIKQISGMVGYSDPNYFTWTFKKREGISPIKYRYENTSDL